MLTAQDAQASDQTKQQGSIQTAQNALDQAQQALNKSNATLQNTIAQQNATLQSAQNTIAQDQAALQSQQATAAQTLAGPTQADLQVVNAQVANAQAALQTAQNNLEAATLVAPANGTVASLNGTVGQLIGGGATTGTTASSTTSSTTSSTGSAFITLMDVTTPQISAAISEADIGKVQPGQKATFTVTAYPGRTFTGTVAAIEPAGTTTSNVVTYVVLISVDLTDVVLLPDMTANVTIITQEADNALIVPNSAISYAQSQAATGTASGAQAGGAGGARQAAGRNGAGGAQANAGAAGAQPAAFNAATYVLQNGAPARVPIQTGITDGVSTQVIAGLQPGDQVVTGTRPGSSSSSSSASSATSGSRSILPSGPGAGGGFRGPGG